MKHKSRTKAAIRRASAAAHLREGGMIDPPEGMTRIEQICTGVDLATGLICIEFIEDGEVTFCAMVGPAELDKLIDQLQEQRAMIGTKQ